MLLWQLRKTTEFFPTELRAQKNYETVCENERIVTMFLN